MNPSLVSAQRFHSETKMIGPVGSPIIPLPPASLPLQQPGAFETCADLSVSLGTAIALRRTSREFLANASLPLSQFSRLLALSCGQIEWSASDTEQPRRAAPTPGGLYPIETRLIVFRVESLEAGIYAYLPETHALRPLSRGDFTERLEPLLLDQPWMLRASVIWMLSGDFSRIAKRYASRGYRYLLLECGHIAQNLYLLGAAFGLGVQAAGGFVDDGVRTLACLGENTVPLYLLAVGPAANVKSPQQG